MSLEQSKLVEWKNEDGKRIVWMITDQENIGVVIFSDNLVKLGTTTNLSDYKVYPYVGTVNINSAASLNNEQKS